MGWKGVRKVGGGHYERREMAKTVSKRKNMGWKGESKEGEALQGWPVPLKQPSCCMRGLPSEKTKVELEEASLNRAAQ